MDWRLLTCLVCFYGFLKDFRPSDAFLTRYLMEDKNFTIQQVDHVIYPWYTYFFLVWLVPVLLLTDLCRYKPMVIVDSLARVGTWAFLLWAHGLTAFKISQIVFSLSSAATVSYYAYIYANVSEEHFQKVTGFIHCAALIGKFSGHLVGQLLISFDATDLYHLNLITFVDMCIGFAVSLTFPKTKDPEESPQYSRLNNNVLDDKELSKKENALKSGTTCEKLRSGIRYIRQELKTIYASRSVKIWSVWWALAACGYSQVSSYIQNIWAVIAPHRTNRKLYNGGVEAAGTLIGSFSVLLVGFLPWDWSVRGRGEGLMAAVFAVNSVCMVLIATTKEIWVAYVLYDVFRATYHAALTMASAQIAKSLPRRRYGFVFGCNTLATLVIDTVFTIVVVDESGMNADVHVQFEIYGGLFGLLAVIFIIVAVVTVNRDGCCCHGNTEIVTMEEASINHGDL